MTESQLVRDIMIEAPKYDCRLFRNNVGVLEDLRGNKVRFGLAIGSADLIGWCNRLTTVAQFVAIEVKMPGRQATSAQHAFLKAVNEAGGLAGIAYSIDDFKRIIGVT